MTATAAAATSQTLRIEGEFTIYGAMELKPVLFAQPPVTEIDLSGVTEFDSSGLQLLMLAKKTAVAQGRALVLLGRSPVVVEVFELLGVAGYFDDPLTIRSNANAAVRSSDGS